MTGAERSHVDFDGGRRLPLYSWGSGPTVLLAHGWSGRGSQMAVFVEPLVEHGFRVVTFDAPGHGDADGKLTGLPELALVIERVAAEVGPVHAIVAHSLGAAATTIALSRGLSVARVVYVAPPENPGHYLSRVADYLGFTDEVARRAQERIERRFAFPFTRARGTSLAAALDVPLLVIHDAGDREVIHEEGVRLVRGWSGAELLTTTGLGHNRILGDSRVVAAVLGFVSAAAPAWAGERLAANGYPGWAAAGRSRDDDEKPRRSKARQHPLEELGSQGGRALAHSSGQA